MAKSITITIPRAAGYTIPFAAYEGSMSAANLRGHFVATFNTAGVAVVNVSSVSTAHGVELITIGTNSLGSNNETERGFTADVPVFDDTV